MFGEPSNDIGCDTPSRANTLNSSGPRT